MALTIGEKIRIILGRKDMTITELAEKIGTSRQNLTNKFKRDNFCEKELKQITESLNCTFEINIILNDTGEKI